MRVRVFLTVVVICVLGGLTNGFCQEFQDTDDRRLPHYRIGIVTDGPLINRPEAVSVFKQEILQMAKGEFHVTFPPELTKESDSTLEGINRNIQSLMDNPECALVLVLGSVGSTEMLKREDFSKPVVAPLVYDATLQKAPLQGVGSGVPNLYYVDLGSPLDQEIITFRNLVDFKSLAILLDERDIKGITAMDRLASYIANEHSLEVEIVPVGSSVADVKAMIPKTVQAALVGELWQLPADDIRELAQFFIQRQLPAFSVGAYSYVESGLLATTMPENGMDQLARQVAINVQEILMGENAAELPVAFSKRHSLTINMATARAIGVYPSLDYMTGAKLLNEERTDIERKVTLDQIVSEALTANLDLVVAEREVAAANTRSTRPDRFFCPRSQSASAERR